MSRRGWLAIMASSAALGGSATAAAADWNTYRFDVTGSGNPGEALTEGQAQGFHQVWTASAPPLSNPVTAGGVLYVIDNVDVVLDALDASSGQAIWSRNVAANVTVACASKSVSLGPVGAAGVVGTNVVLPGGDGVVYALDRNSGAVVWQTQVADPASKDEFLWSSTFSATGRLYFGVATLLEDQCGEAPGHLVALDGSSGAIVATWSGAVVWSTPTYDAETHKLFVSTGSGLPGATLSQSIVAIDPATLATLDSFTVPGAFALDYDFGGSPTLFDLPGGSRLVAAINKNGTVYALNRDDLAAGPVWTYVVATPGANPDSGQGSVVSPAYASGTLFVGGGATPDGHPGSVAALDPATGNQKWVYHPNGYVLPALTATGDVLFAGVTDPTTSVGALIVLSQATGALLYTQSTSTPVWGEPTYSNGMLFFGDELGKLYALAPGPAASGSSGGTGGSTGGSTDGGSGITPPSQGASSVDAGVVPPGGKAGGCSSAGGATAPLLPLVLVVLALRSRGSPLHRGRSRRTVHA